MISDLFNIFNWWFVLFLIGVIFLPLTVKVFSNFLDRGYIFSRILGMVFITYITFFLATLKILPFTQQAVLLILLIFLGLNIFLISKHPIILVSIKNSWKIFLFEEILFFAMLLLWVYIRAHEPGIYGLEKYMDFGFINSILRADYFPPRDMWYTPLPINYYYFGHLTTAVLTKISDIPSYITYNLMIATLFALTFSSIFSLSFNLSKKIAGGILSAFLVTLSGNLHTIYGFFVPYNTDSPVPFWKLNLDFNFSNYWYPNATRFIPFTIHEFPLYSFVVSDLHGHVLDIPFVLLTIGLLLSILISKSINLLMSLLLSLLIAVMYMTNAWDGLIYAGLILFVFIYLAHRTKNYTLYAIFYTLIIIGSILFSLPFSLNFKPFVQSLGVICASTFLTSIGKIGPFLFEPNHCQRSPIWQLVILHGFWYFWIISFAVFLIRKTNIKRFTLNASDIFIIILVLISTLLLLAPEFVYAKDIYPAHYRANTMFKLGYQAFIMLGIATGYIISRLISDLKFKISHRLLLAIILVIGSTSLFLVGIYPYFAISSYYGSFRTYQGIDGLLYLKKLRLSDFDAISWINKNITGLPVILEAVGESYTDYARISANSGLPTVLGWPVHEWLWRGSYDVASPRIGDVKDIYETKDLNVAQDLIRKYNVSLVFVGELERQKYISINEEKFQKLGKIIYNNNETRIYQINP